MAGKMPEMKLDISIATALVSAGDSSGRKGACRRVNKCRSRDSLIIAEEIRADFNLMHAKALV